MTQTYPHGTPTKVVGDFKGSGEMRHWLIIGAQLRAADPERFGAVVDLIERINGANEVLEETRDQIGQLIRRLRQGDQHLAK